jgi:hypothetical protein
VVGSVTSSHGPLMQARYADRFWVPKIPSNGLTKLVVKDVTSAANAAPMTKATAICTKLPLRMNSTKPFIGGRPFRRRWVLSP